mmetsp:Transcript_14387/g.41531  ORF Transcript_14387/g.41531 Transcript_14387/m.41531 type:complete len:85 (-) Transcript_14387:351-605(-)
MMLIYQCKTSMWVAFDFAISWFEIAHDKFYQRRFSISIFTKEHNSRLGSDTKFTVLKQPCLGGIGIAESNIEQLHNIAIQLSTG